MVLVLCKRIPVTTKLRHTALTRITILSLVIEHPLHCREIILRTGLAQVIMEKDIITQVRMLHTGSTSLSINFASKYGL